MRKILITGAGSLIGQGIIRTIKQTKKKYYLVGTDYFTDAVGLFWVDRSYILPDIFKQKNINAWKRKILQIISKEKIDLLIPGLDFELELLFEINNILKKKKSKCKIIISDKKILKIFQDKWLTINYLKNKNLPFPKTTLLSGLKKFLKKNKFPLIVKPRVGSTSKNVFLVKNLHELKKTIKKCQNPIIQEYLYANDNEYTCGTVTSNGEILSSIVLKRKLKNGNTIKASYSNNITTKSINKYLISLSREINPEGPLNFQLCYKNNKPYIFEINPRFSGTTPLRQLFGINEIEVYINFLFEKKIQKIKKKFKEGTIIRYFDDYFIRGKNL